MKRDDVMKMEAGRELDALVAEKVMGWTRVPGPTVNGGPRREPEYQFINERGTSEGYHAPSYSTEIAAAWEVFEKCRAASVGRNGDNGYRCVVFVRDGSKFGIICDGDAPTAPLAICRAAIMFTLAPADAGEGGVGRG